MSWLGFDFDGDGDVSFVEHMFSMDMLGVFDEEKKKGYTESEFDETCEEYLDELGSDEYDEAEW